MSAITGSHPKVQERPPIRSEINIHLAVFLSEKKNSAIREHAIIKADKQTKQAHDMKEA